MAVHTSLEVVDLDPIPPHVLRFYGSTRLTIGGKVVTATGEGWCSLEEASELLDITLIDALRAWYSGLCDAAIAMERSRRPARDRYLRLPRWTPEEGKELLLAVDGKERLQGKPADLGRAGLLALLETYVRRFEQEIRLPPQVPTQQQVQQAFEAAARQFCAQLANSRFEAQRFPDVRTVRHGGGQLPSRATFVLSMEIWDKLLECSYKIGRDLLMEVTPEP